MGDYSRLNDYSSKYGIIVLRKIEWDTRLQLFIKSTSIQCIYRSYKTN